MLPTVDTYRVLTELGYYFLPESIICVAIVLMLVVRLFSGHSHLGLTALAATAGALAVAVYLWLARDGDLPAFTGLIVSDPLTQYGRMVVLGASLLTIILTLITGIPDREDSGDFHVLLLGGTLGMLLMASANHLLMVYIAVEMASLPSYALAGFLKGKREGSEAALKYVVYGGGASGVMLFGISLLAGRFGTGYLPDLAQGYALAMQAQSGGQVDAVLILGTLLILVGLAFKLSAVPFHFWCPDVFEGAAAEVAAFLSVASKAAAFVLTGRLVLELARHYAATDLLPVYFGPPLAFLAALTATFGNLAAYAQTNLKRLLAYSTIAHAGYMLMGLSTATAAGGQAVLFYLATYVFMNLGAFAVVAFLRNRTGSEDLASFRGLARRSPGAVVLLAIFLLSLLGIPPLVGFAAKFQVFAVVFDAGQKAGAGPHPWLGGVYYALLVIGGVNTAISAVYYIRVLKVMVLDRSLEEVEGQEPARVRVPAAATSYATVMALAVVGLGVAFDQLTAASRHGVRTFDTTRPQVTGLDVRPSQPARPARGGGGGGRQQPRPEPQNPPGGGNRGGV
jgi:NADH-quinone oxidoreductase subunit N